MRQSERRRLVPVEDLTSDLNSETDFNHSTCSIGSSVRHRHNNNNTDKTRTNMNNSSNARGMQLDLKGGQSNCHEDIKTPDFDVDEAFQVKEKNSKIKMNQCINVLDSILLNVKWIDVATT